MKLPAFLQKILVIVGVTTVVALFMNFRLGRAGDWLPTLPETVADGGWHSFNEPLPASVLEVLGNTQGAGRTYVNPFGEYVSVSIISATSFEAFQDPTICSPMQGFFVKAEARPEISPRNVVRAMLVRNPTRNVQAISYYWLQNDDGSTATTMRTGSYTDIVARTQTGLDAVLWGHRTVLVRIFTFVPQADKDGKQAHRNVLQIARVLHAALREDAKKGV